MSSDAVGVPVHDRDLAAFTWVPALRLLHETLGQGAPHLSARLPAWSLVRPSPDSDALQLDTFSSLLRDVHAALSVLAAEPARAAADAAARDFVTACTRLAALYREARATAVLHDADSREQRYALLVRDGLVAVADALMALVEWAASPVGRLDLSIGVQSPETERELARWQPLRLAYASGRAQQALANWERKRAEARAAEAAARAAPGPAERQAQERLRRRRARSEAFGLWMSLVGAVAVGTWLAGDDEG